MQALGLARAFTRYEFAENKTEPYFQYRLHLHLKRQRGPARSPAPAHTHTHLHLLAREYTLVGTAITYPTSRNTCSSGERAHFWTVAVNVSASLEMSVQPSLCTVCHAIAIDTDACTVGKFGLNLRYIAYPTQIFELVLYNMDKKIVSYNMVE